jgi:predicted DNA-binding protein (MmcQ/YjbR family)
MSRGSEVTRLRKLCLAFPEAQEKEAWGDPTFRVRDKIFAMHKIGDGRSSVWCKSEPQTRDVLTDDSPQIFFVPPYVGPKGWIGIRLDEAALDWKVLAELVKTSYCLIAPKSLARVVRG